MKITKVEYAGNNFKYKVYFAPNFLECLFGVKAKEIIYKDHGRYFYDSEGNKLSSLSNTHDALLKFIRKENFNRLGYGI